MPENEEREFVEVVIVLEPLDDEQTKAVVKELKSRGLQVDSVDNDNSVVEGVCESAKVKELEKLDCVDYVRTTFSWIADYPPGDPRDQDKVAREYDED